MSLYIDKMFVNRIAPKLERFKQKSEWLWNFRCCLCGDSHKNKFKTRGYIYRRKSDLFYTCHNCGTSISFGNFLKTVDSAMYRQYIMERFKNESHGNVPKPDFKKDVGLGQTPVFRKYSKPLNLPSIESLKKTNPDHIAVRICKERLIPEDSLKSIYYTSDFKQFVLEIRPEYEQRKLKDNDARIVLPFYDDDHNLLGIQGRAVDPNNKIRYITIKLDDDNRKVYGLDRIDKTRRIYVTEGPIDSLFLNNAIAMMDASLYNAVAIVGKHDYTFVYDNEPRNRDVTKHMKKTIEMGLDICIWPSYIEQKDINDMVKAGMPPAAVQSIIDTNTFNGLRANLEMTRWSKT